MSNTRPFFVGFLSILPLLSSCSLEPKSAERVFRFEIEAPKTSTADSRLANLIDPSVFMLPASTNDFACLALNVVGPGIGNTGHASNGDLTRVHRDLLNGSRCSYRGISDGPIFKNQTTNAFEKFELSVSLPTGAQRIIQVVGVVNAADCTASAIMRFPAPAGSTTGRFYEVGRAVLDLFSDSSVSISDRYTLDSNKNQRRIDCPQIPVNVGGKLSAPAQMIQSGGMTFIADSGNHRILVWNTDALPLPPEPDAVLGQPNATSNLANAGGAPSAQTLNSPSSIALYSGAPRHLWVADTGNNRVLRYEFISTLSNQQAADVVVGQPDFTTVAGATAVDRLKLPRSIAISNYMANLAIADSGNHRVLYYPNLPTTNGEPASQVLGQATFNSGTANYGGISDRSLNSPAGVSIFENTLSVADSGNHRILVFDEPTANYPSAYRVLGQTSFTSNAANANGSSSGLNMPRGVSEDANRIYAADTNHHRIAVWEKPITANGETIAFVLGQNSPSTAPAENQGGLSARSLRYPLGMSSGAGLLVFDQGNNRILKYSTEPSVDFAPADEVVGQPNFTSSR